MIQSERWHQIEQICEAALKRQVTERAAFLKEACRGDEALRQEVDRLLAHEQTAEGFLEAPALEMAAKAMAEETDRVLIGKQLGAYRITSLLGAGGMGEVYRARDTKLGRDVAIKVLPPAFTADTERLARFEREARLLASLNHPNIAAIYGIEDGTGTRALVLELVEGATLAERLAAGRLPINEVLAIARQIVDALDVAHERGIIHRDLKPANVKITPEGTVKVLDFGLAKVLAEEGADSDLSQAPTITAKRTREGVILGTPAYMSPEQARGQAADKRTDIWAFGCVLYEMLTGQRPFGGDTVSDVIAAILEREPDWRALPAETTAGVQRLLRRCLTKDPKRRLRDIGDAGVFLDEAADAPQHGVNALARETHSRSGSTRGHRLRIKAVVIAGAALACVVVVGLLWRDSSTHKETSLALGEMAPVTFDSGLATDPSLSADGRLLAYASNRKAEGNLDVYVQQTTGGPAIQLTTDSADDYQTDISPDGSLVAFRSERDPAGVYVAEALAGRARLIARDGRSPRFSPDGRLVAFEKGPWLAPVAVNANRELFVVAATGGEPSQLATNLVNAGGPVWAPDGQSLLVVGRKGRAGEDVALDWWRVPNNPGAPAVSTGVFAQLAASGFRLDADTFTIPYPRQWTSDGVLFSATMSGGDTLNIWWIGMDAHTARPTAPPVRLTTGTTFDSGVAVSKGGQLVWSALTRVRRHLGVPLDANRGRATGTPMKKLHDDSAPSGRSAISQDGRLLIFPRYEGASGILWAKDLQTGDERQLVVTPRTPLNPIVSADGRWAAYTVTRVQTGGDSGNGDGYVIETTGGTPRKVCENCQVAAWSREGQLVFGTGDRGKLIRFDMATGALFELINGRASHPMFGPDGTWMVFNAGNRIVRAPVHADRATSEPEWTTLWKDSGLGERLAGLSPDGSVLYVLLVPDGFRCLYGMRLDPRTGYSQGSPFPVAHFHDTTLRWGTTGTGNAVASGVFVVDLFETRGNIWTAQLGRGGSPAQ